MSSFPHGWHCIAPMPLATIHSQTAANDSPRLYSSGSSTAGSLVHLLLVVLVDGYRRPRMVERALFFLALGLFLFYAGALLALTVVVVALGLGFLPPLLPWPLCTRSMASVLSFYDQAAGLAFPMACGWERRSLAALCSSAGFGGAPRTKAATIPSRADDFLGHDLRSCGSHLQPGQTARPGVVGCVGHGGDAPSALAQLAAELLHVHAALPLPRNRRIAEPGLCRLGGVPSAALRTARTIGLHRQSFEEKLREWGIQRPGKG